MEPMSNELIDVGAYERITDVPAFIKQMGRAIALSQMFGIDKEAQGEILALECLTRRQPPLALAERYHFIFGKLTMKAETMLADFRSRFGGEYEIVERTESAAAIALTLKGVRHLFRFTWEEAQKEPFPYIGKEDAVVEQLASANGKRPKLKAKYSTPRARMQMLWARVVSDAIRCVAPEVLSGAYTPEEIEDFDELQDQVAAAEKSNGNGKHTSEKPKTATVVESASVVTTPAASTPEPVSATSPAQSTTSSTPEPLCDASDVDKIMQLLEVIQPTKEAIDGILAKRGVSNWRQLTKSQATKLIEKLQEIADQVVADMEAAKATEAAQFARNDDPATDDQVKQIKALASEIEQNQPGFSARLVDKIKSSGLLKLADLTISEADALIQQLGLKNIQAFIDGTLTGHARFKAATQASANPTSPPVAA